MLLQNPLNDILGQASKLKLLRFMINTNAEMNGSELANAVGMSHVKCNMALQELSKHGLIIFRKIGKSNLYTLQKKHVLYTDFLKPLFDSEASLFKILAETIVLLFKDEKPLSIAVFGSNAKGEATPISDIDILVIVKNNNFLKIAEEVLDIAEERISSKFGNQLSPLVVSLKTFQQKCKSKDSLYRQILKNNIVIYGKELIEVL